ncbi:hypothetical protein V5799_004363 [Amblyomma americanum]|uniref:Uncharacterized protein n=1 Tax=Amblyomma americanum TaxID=6943 RepID=A0AAQ4D6B0_AMBAM
MRPFQDHVPATASAALGRFGDERCAVIEHQDRTLSPVWGTGSSYRRSSVSLEDDVSKLTSSERSKTSLGHRSSLSKYTPLPAIGSIVPQEEPEGANADEPCGSDGAESSHSHNSGDASDFENEEADSEDKAETGSESEGTEDPEVADGHLNDEEGQDIEQPQPEVDESEDQQQQDVSPATESAPGESRPPLVRSRTFTVLKVDDPDERESGDEGGRASKKGGIAFFIGGADDGDGEDPAEGTGEDRDSPAN